MAILTGMTAAAAVVNNTVLMKPAEQSSAIAKLLMKRSKRLGFQVTLSNSFRGEERPSAPRSSATHAQRLLPLRAPWRVACHHQGGWSDRQSRAQVRRVICEMGGKDAIIVDDDADLDEAVAGVVDSVLRVKCSACSRMSSLMDPRRLLWRSRTRWMRCISSSTPRDDLGPVVDGEALEKVARYQAIPATEGTLLAQALRQSHYAPASLPASAAKNWPEEVFGPSWRSFLAQSTPCARQRDVFG